MKQRIQRFRPVFAAALALLPCCSSPPPVRVVPREEQELHRELDLCALNSDTPSAWTSWVLRLLELDTRYREDPQAALRVLHEQALREGSGPTLFSLAELAYLTGKREGSRDCYLSAAVYAYLYLIPDDPRAAPSPFDRRFGWACDIYNRSLALAFRDPKESLLQPAPGERDLPVGSLHVEVDFSDFPFPTEGLELLPANELQVIGLSYRVRDSGLGVPLIAVARQRGQGTAGVGILDRTSVAATAFLRLRGGLSDLAGGLPAVLELHSSFDTASVDVPGGAVPLESDLSATIAYGIQSADLWRFDIRGLFKSDDAARQNGLILPQPFQAGRIPVVLVHGTASNPAYWAELLNGLSADPVIRSRYQFWLFIYSTGNPVVYSASTLRRALAALCEQHDPEGKDPALRRMVIVGHSQGGLLTRLMGTRVEVDDVTRDLLGHPLEDLGLDEEQMKLMRECFDIEPVPSVERLVFVATPHRGSFLTTRWYSRWFAKLIAVPSEIASIDTQLLGTVPKEDLPDGLQLHVQTSLDNMDPNGPLVQYLQNLPIDPRMRAHSIIPIGDAQDPHGADDGVVEYESAHLAGVDSEVLVPSKHSCQSHPRTMIELRRILREHLEQEGSAP